MITVADSNVPVTPGSGVTIDTYQLAGGDHQQFIREVRGTAKGSLPNIPWTVTTAGLSSVIPADATRVGLILVSSASGIVWFRFDATIPTSTAYDWFMSNGDRWEVPLAFSQFAVSMAGQSAGGVILGAAATCA